jgi:hypothetical protein
MLAVGYMRKYPLMSEPEVARVKASLANCAHRGGYTTGTVHIEELHSDPKAFLEAVAAINLFHIAAVVVPTFAHLPLLGLPGDPHRASCRCPPGICFSGLRCGRSASRSR